MTQPEEQPVCAYLERHTVLDNQDPHDPTSPLIEWIEFIECQIPTHPDLHINGIGNLCEQHFLLLAAEPVPW